MDNKQQLFEKAEKVRLCAYAPYSKFSVGAALITTSGKIFAGCNVENVSYPCGTCAEANAIGTMIANAEKDIAEILIIADTENILPCGNCLQKIAEFGNSQTLIHSADVHHNIKTYKLSDLLPHIFNAKEVKNV